MSHPAPVKRRCMYDLIVEKMEATYKGTAEKYKCEECFESFSNLNSLEIHSYEKHSSDVATTNEMKETTSNSIKTENKKTNDRYKCHKCNEPFFNLISLKSHCNEKHSSDQTTGKRDNQVEKLQVKVKRLRDNAEPSETGGEEFEDGDLDDDSHQVYPETSQGSSNGSTKKSSSNYKKARGTKNHECDICGKFLSSSSNLTVHRRLHTGEKLFKCDVCDKSFNEKNGLKVHFQTHTGVKTFKCHLCDKLFGQAGNLKNHIRTHTGEKPYKCEACNKSFSQSNHLKYHIRIQHTGEKPYKCDFCDKLFSTSSNRKVHMRSHTGEKPYKCDVCNKQFSYSPACKKHEKIHLRENLFDCKICGKSFTRSGNLERHMSSSHNEEEKL